ncbi:hypothetical protein D3C81_1235800 [compost metagenome]
MSNGLEAVSGFSSIVIALLEEKPARHNLVMQASAPPAIITSASPLCITLNASPIVFVEVAQAVTAHSTNPLAPYFIAISPEAILDIIIGTKNGLTLPGPFSRSTLC